jgi:oxygen-independent coproporphyrinogen-3 oxidase
VTPCALYVHIPYCGQRCPYCDFNTYVEAKIPEQEYTEALIRELELRSQLPEWRKRELSSIFFGGGTPTLFNPTSLQRVIDKARELFFFPVEIEISVEANPGTLDKQKCEILLRGGVNRLSFGSQSFNRSALKVLGRAHQLEDTYSAYQIARDTGFRNINLDLMYGLPQQSFKDFEHDLAELISLAPDHVSAYQLTIEKGTPFFVRHAQGELVLPPDDSILLMMDLLEAELPRAGYAQYEISNYAQHGKVCVHNRAYWIGKDYLGIGAGAHSFFHDREKRSASRWANLAKPSEFIESLKNNSLPNSWSDTLNSTALAFEFFYLGLRRSEGVSREEYKDRFGASISEAHEQIIASLIHEGLLITSGGRVSYSQRGRRLSDSVVERFVIDGEH